MARFCSIAIVAMLFSCKPVDSFKKGIEQYLSANLRDFSSYEPIEYELPTIVYSDFNETPRVKEVNAAMDSMLTELTRKPKTPSREKRFDAIYDSCFKILDSANSRFVPKPVGYSIKHSYWEKDYYGKKVKKRKEFEMNLQFQVIDVVNLDPNKNKQ